MKYIYIGYRKGFIYGEKEIFFGGSKNFVKTRYDINGKNDQ